MTSPREVLLRHPFFQGLDEQLLEPVLASAEQLEVAPGELVFRENDEATRLYVIDGGRIALEIQAPGTGTVIIETLSTGDILGWSWMVAPYRKRFAARAVEPTRLLATNGRLIRQLCESNHDLGYEVARRILEVVAQRLQATRLQLLDVYNAQR